jgi:predicted RecB family endonuclease
VELARRRVAAEAIPPAAEPPAKAAAGVAEDLLVAAGFTVVARNGRIANAGLTVDLTVDGQDGRRWSVDVSGALTVTKAGLARTDEVWQAIGRASLMPGPVLLLTSHLPAGDGAKALKAAGLDAIGLTSPDAPERLRRYAGGMEPSRPD